MSSVEKFSIKEPTSSNDAVSLLVQAAIVGQKRGAWKLEEAELLNKAIKILLKKEDKKST